MMLYAHMGSSWKSVQCPIGDKVISLKSLFVWETFKRHWGHLILSNMWSNSSSTTGYFILCFWEPDDNSNRTHASVKLYKKSAHTDTVQGLFGLLFYSLVNISWTTMKTCSSTGLEGGGGGGGGRRHHLPINNLLHHCHHPLGCGGRAGRGAGAVDQSEYRRVRLRAADFLWFKIKWKLLHKTRR